MKEKILYGAVDAGGTKFVCGIGSEPLNLEATQILTTTPESTIAEVLRFSRHAKAAIRAIGIGSFGPVDLHRGSPTFGYITSTPNAGWKNCNLSGSRSGNSEVP